MGDSSAFSKFEEDPRESLIKELTDADSDDSNDLLQFARRTSLRTYTTIDRLREIVKQNPVDGDDSGIHADLDLVARMIIAGFGTRIFYVSMDGFDTHANQKESQNQLLQELAMAIRDFFKRLGPFSESNASQRVLLMTFSEFGRRVDENGSHGTGHGAASNMFLVGSALKGGLVGRHPSLERDSLDGGDLRFHTDFRQVYATVLDQWLKCDSQRVLGNQFKHVDLFKNPEP